MSTRSIPKNHWCDELDSFSREHEGWRADVRVLSPRGEVRTEAHGLPLVGVSCDAPNSARIAVLAGHRTDDHLTHEIANAVAVDIERGEGSERLRIRAADGSETSVDFKASR